MVPSFNVLLQGIHYVVQLNSKRLSQILRLFPRVVHFLFKDIKELQAFLHVIQIGAMDQLPCA